MKWMNRKQFIFVFLLLFLGVFLYWKYRVPHNVVLENIHFIEKEKAASAATIFDRKITLLSFYASWCPPCMQELPTMAALKDSIADPSFQIICVSDEPIEKYAHLEKKYAPKLIFLQLAEKREALNIPTIPTNYIIDKNMTICYQKVGEENWNSAEKIAYIRKLLQ